MYMDTVLRELRVAFKRPSGLRAFETIQRENPDLRGFRSPEALTRFLNGRGAKGHQARSALTATLIGAAQREPDSQALDLLVAAFIPSLIKIRHTLWLRDDQHDEDVNALVLECFCERAMTFNLRTQGTLAVINLVLGARKMVLRYLRRDLWRFEQEEFYSKRHFEALPSLRQPSPEVVLLELEEEALAPDPMARLAALLVGETLDDIQMLLETYGRDCALIEWVDEQLSGIPEGEFHREYARLRRRRSRSVQRIRRREQVSQRRQRWALWLRQSGQPQRSAEVAPYALEFTSPSRPQPGDGGVSASR